MDSYDFLKDWRITKCSVPLEIVSFLNEAFFIVEIRRCVGKVKGITFEVRSREQNHSVPHIYASYGEYAVSIAVGDGIILSGNLPKKRERIASEWVIAHKDRLLSDWKNYAVSATSIMTQSLLNTDFDRD